MNLTLFRSFSSFCFSYAVNVSNEEKIYSASGESRVYRGTLHTEKSIIKFGYQVAKSNTCVDGYKLLIILYVICVPRRLAPKSIFLSLSFSLSHSLSL